MKIYFSAPISQATDELRENYKLIKKTLEDLGHSVFAGYDGKTAWDIKQQDENMARKIHRKLEKMKKQADLIVLEVSTSSLAIGQELEFAIANKKKVVALHLPGKEPHLLDGGDETFYLVEYKADELPSLLEDYIEIARDQMDVRFNFFVSPKIVNYLDWISQKRRMPRAVYLRKLIENKIKQDELYQKSVE